MHIAIVDGPTTLALLQELIPLANRCGVTINVAWVRPNQLIDTLVNHPERIARLRYGISFAHTNPYTIQQIWGAGIECFVAQPSPPRVFHPKEYFLCGKNWSAALIGSSNLTAGGLGGIGNRPGNEETSMFFFHGTVEKKMTQTRTVLPNAYGSAVIAASESNLADPDIVSQWSAQSGTKYAGFSTTVDQKHLDRYTKIYKAEQDKKFKANAEKRRVKLGELTDDKRGWLLNLSWKSYLALLKETPDELDERLTILSDTLNIMNAAHHQFTDISQTNDRLAIAGVIRQRSDTSDPLNWFLFGNMSQNPGEFKKMLIHPDAQWKRHINTLSDTSMYPALNGEQAHAIMVGLRRSGISVGRITRLMAMLRPAEFLPFTASNNLGLQRALGLPKRKNATNSQDEYLRILMELRSSPWYQTPINAKWSDEDQTIWRYRMALVDMLVYGG